MTTGQRVRMLRREAGLSQMDFAAAIGSTPQVISNIERGYSGAKPSLLDRIAVYFSVPMDYLMGLTDTRSKDYFTTDDDDERDLLEGFRSMSKKERRILLGTMEEILAARKE